MERLRLYTDPTLTGAGRPLLWMLRPLHQDMTDDIRGDRPVNRIFKDYYRQASDIFAASTLENCDLAVLPVDWQTVRGGSHWASKPDPSVVRPLARFVKQAKAAGKPVLVFFTGGRSHEPLPFDGVLTLRYAMYRSRRGDGDFAMPVLHFEDLLAEPPGRALSIRRKADKPVVGFCGFSRPVRLSERAKSLAYYATMLLRHRRLDVWQYKGLHIRQRAISCISASDRVDTNFLIRTRSVYLTRDVTAEDKLRYRAEYIDNMMDSDFQLSARGSANHSRRPWEALCCGRVPAFIDTDCVLPYENVIDWTKYMVVVDESDLPRLPEAIADFWSGVSEDDYSQLQSDCRRLWEDYLTPQGVARNLHKLVSLQPSAMTMQVSGSA